MQKAFSSHPNPTGAYTADRAAALSGVHKCTLYRWARNETLVPSVSAGRAMLWSYADLIGLRAIYWLRRLRAPTDAGVNSPTASKAAERRALEELYKLDTRTGHPGDRHAIFVDRAGRISLRQSPEAQDLRSQRERSVDLLAPFDTHEGNRGPDLVVPRPELRIVPGKLGGSPHVVGTRNETCVLAALARDGFITDGILALYPHLTRDQIEQAVDLELQLDENLLHKAAA